MNKKLSAPKFGVKDIAFMVMIFSLFGIFMVVTFQIPEPQLKEITSRLMGNPIFMLLVWLSFESAALLGYFIHKDKLSKKSESPL